MTILPKQKSSRRSSGLQSQPAANDVTSTSYAASRNCSVSNVGGSSHRSRDYTENDVPRCEGSSCSGRGQRKRRHEQTFGSAVQGSPELFLNSLTSVGVDPSRRFNAGLSKLGDDGKSADVSRNEQGYNSDDEHFGLCARRPNEAHEREFEEILRKNKGFVIKKMRDDGACLFRAVADQVYGDQEMHGTVRKFCMDYMAQNAEFFSQYVTEDFQSYLLRKRNEHVHGNHVEIQAVAEIFNRVIEVYEYNTEPINIFHGAQQNENAPIRLSYHFGSHYNSVVDPFAASIGVGLGLPEFHPGLAEKNLMRDAIKISESDAIEQAMLQDKLKMTELEATERALAAAVTRESYRFWFREQVEKKKKHHSTRHQRRDDRKTSSPHPQHSNDFGRIGSPKGSAAGANVGQNSGHNTSFSTSAPVTHCNSATSISKPNSPAASLSSHENSPKAFVDPGQQEPMNEGFDAKHPAFACIGSVSPQPGPSNSSQVPSLDLETASLFSNLPPALFGLDDWSDDRDILSQVLAISQQEYLEGLRKTGR